MKIATTLGNYHFYRWGVPEFFVVKGGTSFFSVFQRGDQNFSAYAKGGGDQNFLYACKGGDQKKLTTGHHKQTAPLPIKMIAPLTLVARAHFDVVII